MKQEYFTKQRGVILEFLRESSTHTSAKDILAYLNSKNIKISTATVYRTLDKFEKEGLIKKMTIGEGVGACYQYVGSTSCQSHFHLKCIECGELIHLSCDFLDKMEKHIFDEHSFTISSGKTVIYGKCAKCSGVSKAGCKCHSHGEHDCR